jgi:uncharacterized membrane protein (DUF373 family)
MNILKTSERLDRLVVFIELAVSGTLVLIGAFLAVVLVVDFVIFVLSSIQAGVTEPETLKDLFGHEGVFVLLNHVLVVFIVVELFKIAVAYMNHESVVGTVLEAGLIAVVRQFVLFEQGTIEKAAALSLLAVSVGIVWFLLYKSGVKGLDATHTTLAQALVHERKMIDREHRAVGQRLNEERAEREADRQPPAPEAE